MRVQYEMWSDENPFAGIVKELARIVRENRRPVEAGNPFIKAQEAVSHQIIEALDSWGKLRNRVAESIFLSIFGSPVVQAMAGIDPKSERPLRKAPKSTLQRWLTQQRVAELKSRIREGELAEAAIRGLLYAGSARGSVDERGFNALAQDAAFRADAKAYARTIQGDGARAVLYAAISIRKQPSRRSPVCFPLT